MNEITSVPPSPFSSVLECGGHTVQSPPSLERAGRGGAAGRVTQGIWVEYLCLCVLGGVTHQKKCSLSLETIKPPPHCSTIAALLFQRQNEPSPSPLDPCTLTSSSSLTPAAYSTPTPTSPTQSHFLSPPVSLPIRPSLSFSSHTAPLYSECQPSPCLFSLQVQEENIKTPIFPPSFSLPLPPSSYLALSFFSVVLRGAARRLLR